MSAEPTYTPNEQPAAEPPLFQDWTQPQIRPPTRIPHFGHVLLLIPLLGISFFVAVVLLLAAIHFHLYGVSSPQQATTDIHYMLGTEAILYIFTFAASLLIFPLFWHKNLLRRTAMEWRGRFALALAAGECGLRLLPSGDGER